MALDHTNANSKHSIRPCNLVATQCPANALKFAVFATRVAVFATLAVAQNYL